MNPAQENHQRRIRTILGIRAVAIICLAMALPLLGRGIAPLAASPGISQILGDRAYAWSERVLVLLDAPTASDLYHWAISHGAGPALVGLAIYLWLRSPHKLLHNPHPERPS